MNMCDVHVEERSLGKSNHLICVAGCLNHCHLDATVWDEQHCDQLLSMWYLLTAADTVTLYKGENLHGDGETDSYFPQRIQPSYFSPVSDGSILSIHTLL